jgi:N utilization substance protein B
MAEADEAFFAEVVRGVVQAQADIDQAIAKRLASGWRLDRIDATLRAILRAGAYELTLREDVPVEVAIDEYVEITKSFFEGPEPGFVNAALDAIARDRRG